VRVNIFAREHIQPTHFGPRRRIPYSSVAWTHFDSHLWLLFSTITARTMPDTDQDHAQPDQNRVQALKRTLFDLSFLVMNADGTEHISEKMLVRKLERRLEREGSVDVDDRAEELRTTVDEGPDAVHERVLSLADELIEQGGDQAEALADQYLELLKGLIISDANVSPVEYQLFRILCDHWGIDKDMPQP
jgi:uncharacterized tellurite resistance protein B-like protein